MDGTRGTGDMNRQHTRRVIVLGATGSIGRQTLDVIAHLNARCAHNNCAPIFDVVGLAAGSNSDALRAAAVAHDVCELALASGDDTSPGALRTGTNAAERLVREIDADLVVGAMVGFAGLPAMIAAAELGRDIALANKEALVAAGELLVHLARDRGTRLLPVDSEHSGLWQALAAHTGGAWDRAAPPITLGDEIRRVVLTASGGALRCKSRQEVHDATPEQALAHPTWTMGAKVTIDTASLTNKALELVEAAWLFDLDAERLGVLIHPQSIVHAFVEYADHSVVAQLGAPDMRTPIQTALTWPQREPGLAPTLSLAEIGRLDFEEPDLEMFPALGAGFEMIRRAGTSGAVFNAANEIAVQAFLDRSIPFGRVSELSCQAIEVVGSNPIRSMDDVYAADAEGRRFVAAALGTPIDAARHASRG